VLSHLLQYKPYRDYYMERRERGEYIILDNSAHENGIGEGAGKLLLQTLTLLPQEVVVPDALDDSRKTLDFGYKAVSSWYGSDNRMQTVNPRLMYVPQGVHADDWLSCLSALLNLHKAAVQHGAQPDCTIGISKDYGHWPGGLRELLRRARGLLAGHNIEVHLLGSGHDYWTASELAKEFRIRSVDTAKPFVWALNGMRMHLTHWYPRWRHPARPREYFFMTLRNEVDALARHNVEVLRKLVEA
jgi:hypothetical protein